MTKLYKQQELWQTTTTGMEYDRVLVAGIYLVINYKTIYYEQNFN